ncbi:MAG: hypothetical protein ABI333_21395 [bacterium]
MTRIQYLMGAVLLSGLVLSSPAEARSIFLNGVNLNAVDLPAVTLKGCDVHIDAKGNIHITARGYKIQVGAGGGTTRPDPTPTPGTRTVGSANESYYLVSFFNKKGATQYDIELFINGKMVRRIRARSEQVAIDITSHIRRGKSNEIIFVSRKNYENKGRESASPMDYFRVVLGSGFESKGQIVLKQSLVETRRTAAQTRATYTEKHTFIFR